MSSDQRGRTLLHHAFQRQPTLCTAARRVPEECPQSLCDLIARCMQEDPALRPSAKELHDSLKVSSVLRQPCSCHVQLLAQLPASPSPIALESPACNMEPTMIGMARLVTTATLWRCIGEIPLLRYRAHKKHCTAFRLSCCSL